MEDVVRHFYKTNIYIIKTFLHGILYIMAFVCRLGGHIFTVQS